MTFPTPRSALAALVTALVTAGTLTACTAAPQPETTPGFASEAEAFAAAEKTYRAYVDALNDVDLRDPETFEAVYAWTTGEANAGERKSLSGMHADGWSVDGDTVIKAVDPHSWTADAAAPAIYLDVCADVGAVEVRDAAGKSMVSPERPTLQSSSVELVLSDHAPHDLLIASIEGSDRKCGR